MVKPISDFTLPDRPAAPVSAPSGAVDSGASRAAFEAGLAVKADAARDKYDETLYAKGFVQSLWCGWQAALAWQASQGAAVESAALHQRIADLESDVSRLHSDKMDLLEKHVYAKASDVPMGYYTDWPGKRVYSEKPHGWNEPGLYLDDDKLDEWWKPLYDRPAAQASDAIKPTCDVGHAHFTPFYLLSNARRICSREMDRSANWVLAMELFAVGSTSARRICIEADIDPDATSIKRTAIATPKGGE